MVLQLRCSWQPRNEGTSLRAKGEHARFRLVLFFLHFLFFSLSLSLPSDKYFFLVGRLLSEHAGTAPNLSCPFLVVRSGLKSAGVFDLSEHSTDSAAVLKDGYTRTRVPVTS